mgnify:CR=1 FL=1
MRAEASGSCRVLISEPIHIDFMQRDYFEPEWVDETPMDASDEEKKRIKMFKEALWLAYWEAGCPFGTTPQGLHLWTTFETQTTVN